jgi:cytochrome c biogenesis protein CcdA
MLALAALVAMIGLADSLNPSTVAPALVLATRPDGAREVAAFTAGVFLVSTAGGVLLLLGPGEIALHALPHPTARTKHIGEIAAGVVLLALSAATFAGHRHLSRRLRNRDTNERRGSAFVLGAGIMAVELPTALPYFGAIAAILGAGMHAGAAILLVLIFNVAFVAPLLVTLAIRVFGGDRMTARFEALGRWLSERAVPLIAALFGLAGIGLLILGIVGLA